MSFKELHIPCPCGKSSDAYCIDENNSGYCFSCAKSFKGDAVEDTSEYTYEYLGWRNIDKEVFEKYRSKFKINSEGKPLAVAFPFNKDGRQIRRIDVKDFRSEGDMSSPSLFGSNIFLPGSANGIIITEGALDALSAHQMTKLPAVSVRSSSSAFKDCAGLLDYLNSFPKIYLCFDNDEPGNQALAKVAPLFDGDKVYHLKLGAGYKDANEVLQSGAIQDFRKAVENARRFVPPEIVSSYHEVDKILEDEGITAFCTYPFPTVQEMSYGIRPGIVLVTALEGQGKTEIIRAIEAHVLRETDLNVGIIHLEETRKRSIQGLSGYELREPVHLPHSFRTVREVGEAYRRITKRDERVHLINHFDSDDPRDALNLIRFLVVKCGCKIVFLDHITFMVTNSEEDDERKALDYLTSRLEKMTSELSFTLFMVSHVNDDGKTRGSRNISKVANIRIDLQRDHLATNPDERNTTSVTISKNRDGAQTGPAGSLRFDPETFVVTERNPNDDIIPTTRP